MVPDPRMVAALRWLVEAGADEAIGTRPLDRTAARPWPEDGGAAEPAAPPPSNPLPSRPAAPPSPREHGTAGPGTAATPGSEGMDAGPDTSQPARRRGGSSAAAELADEMEARLAHVSDLDQLRRELEAFEGCPLKQTATNLVFGDGTPDAKVMIIGEAPGAEEDRQGVPFVGSSGKLLEQMLNAIGLARSDVFITNVLYWRPPGNRTPTPAELAVCLPFVHRMIELVDPPVLAMLGGTSVKTLLQTKDGIMKLRGRWFDYATPRMAREGRTLPAIASYHPAFLLRQPQQKRAVWADLLAIRSRLEGDSN